MQIFRNPLVLFIILIVLVSLACNLQRQTDPGLVFPTEQVGTVINENLLATTVLIAETASVELVATPILPTEVFIPPGTESPGRVTRTFAPSFTPPKGPTATPKPYCTVLGSVHLYSGPGKNFAGLRTLFEGDLLIPIYYLEQGQTGGAWVQVKMVMDMEIVGWMTAAEDVLVCNIELDKLPAAP